MDFFRKIFALKHKDSEWRGTPRPSTNGTATARSTDCPGLKAPRRNGPRSPTVSQPSRSISSATATATHPPHFPPLENIGLLRPRTAASKETLKETGRPATSHAATTNPSFAHHEVEASGSPYPPKPKHLDDGVHPAYRKVPVNDKNIPRCATIERTNHSNLRTSPRRYQQPHQVKENDQRRAAHQNILSTEGQSPKEPPPPPLPPRIKHSSPSQTAAVPSGTRSSPHRDQQPRRCKDDDHVGPGSSSRTAATLDTSRPLDSRDSDATTLFSDSSSGTAATLDTSRPLDSGDSDATTLYSDTELGTGIATGELEFPALLYLSRNFGIGQPSFDWSTQDTARKLTRKCMLELKSYDQAKQINAVNLLRAGRPSPRSSSTETEHADKAWSLLSPGYRSLRIRHITDDFCLYFFHVYKTLQCGKEIPYQVPVTIRAKFLPRYRNAWKRIQDAESPKNPKLAQWIDNLDGERQGISLIALLEITMQNNGPMQSRVLLRAILNLRTEVKSLRHVSEDQISDFFATFVRAFRTCINDSPQTLDEDTLEGSLNYFSDFWVLCTAQYSNHIAGNCLSLFKATIIKLENIDIPLCLWLFLAGSNLAHNMEDRDVGHLYMAMETELHSRLPSEAPYVVTVFMIIQFLLSVGHRGFFEIMHGLMHAQRRVDVWQFLWGFCARSNFTPLMGQNTGTNVGTFERMALS